MTTYRCEVLDIVGDYCGRAADKFVLPNRHNVALGQQPGVAHPVCDGCLGIYRIRRDLISKEEFMVYQVMQS
jgi:hypothetical protein